MLGSEDFVRLTDPFRRELLAHCYRMLGSVHDAEDLVQETLLRAWRSYGGFEGRSSLRTWLYRIATNACLRALESRSRRPLPSGLGAAERRPGEAAGRGRAGGALAAADAGRAARADRAARPIPAAVASSSAGRRAAGADRRAAVPAAPQRAVLILREVLDWRAAEVAELLGITAAAVNSVLQRARARIDQARSRTERVREPREPASARAAGQLCRGVRTADIGALSRLLAQDVVLEMPPHPTWFSRTGRGRAVPGDPGPDHPGRIRAVETAANGQPALATYRIDADGVLHAHSIQVLTLDQDGGAITRIASFNDAGLFPIFALPGILAAAAGG